MFKIPGCAETLLLLLLQHAAARQEGNRSTAVHVFYLSLSVNPESSSTRTAGCVVNPSIYEFIHSFAHRRRSQTKTRPSRDKNTIVGTKAKASVIYWLFMIMASGTKQTTTFVPRNMCGQQNTPSQVVCARLYFQQ